MITSKCKCGATVELIWIPNLLGSGGVHEAVDRRWKGRGVGTEGVWTCPECIAAEGAGTAKKRCKQVTQVTPQEPPTCKPMTIGEIKTALECFTRFEGLNNDTPILIEQPNSKAAPAFYAFALSAEEAKKKGVGNEQCVVICLTPDH